MAEELKYRLEHNKPECIGCGACEAVAPKHWQMDDDGKSDIIGGKHRKEDEWQEKDITEADYKENMEAAESCPVNVIHITKLKDHKN